MSGDSRAEGWKPRLQVELRGPGPAGAELVWASARPDGTRWFEYRLEAPELGDEETAIVDLVTGEIGDDVVDPGTVLFTLRLVSELDGVDELLHDGSVAVVALDGEERYAVDNDWILERAFLQLDTIDEHDAPRLRVTAFLKGEVDDYQLEAHCFFNGERFAQASLVEGGYAFTANDGSVVAQEVVIEFDGVRGWNNLSDSGWGGDWHVLEGRDGTYEVKLLRESKVTRVIAFEVVDGRIVAPGAVEADPSAGAVIFLDAAVLGSLDAQCSAPGTTPAFYDDATTAAVWLTIDDVYALRAEPVVAPASELDAETAEALQAFFDRAERLINTWESDMVGTSGPWEYGQVLSAEAVGSELPGYTLLQEAAASVPDSHGVELNGESITVGDLRSRMSAIFAAAHARITSASQAEVDVLMPYRSLLSGDKLAVFENHPVNAFVYTTTDRKIIETPQELADADYWYFEGPREQPGTATVDGVTIKVSVQGWRVLGWQFAPDGTIVDEFETQGQGSSAPKSAFERER